MPLQEGVAAEPQPARSVAHTAAPTRWYRIRPLLLLTLGILALGAIEDIYGNTDSGDVYGSDAVQYLDVARAIARHDWHSVLNPLWSQGYPALLALVRPAFAAGAAGDWWSTRSVNFLIFSASYAAFLALLLKLLPLPPSAKERKRWLHRVVPCLLVFAAVQTCLGQVSRVNPDQLVTTLFLVACAQLVKLVQSPRADWRPALLLGTVLGAGFLVKAAFVGLGCDMLLVVAIARWGRRAPLRSVLAAMLIFAAVVAAYGKALSHAVGYTTFGDAGAINYAWHVNRLQKWVHWEGGTQPAAQAWPKPSVARFAQWDSRPPDFGTPVHPSVILQTAPTVYGFAAPLHATYVPYYDPPYFYQGYHDVFRVRYQLIAFMKSLGDLLQVLGKQPMAWALGLWLVLPLRGADRRGRFAGWLHRHWALMVSASLGIALYLPVHLEGRYIAGMLLVLAAGSILAATDIPTLPAVETRRRLGPAGIVLLLGFAAELAVYQGPVWGNLLRGKSPARNTEWQMGTAALAQKLPAGAPIGVIAWTPNLHSDWAYIAHLQITSEIASGPDYDRFWHLPPDRQAATLATFRRAGAVAVFVNGKPPGLGGPEWQQLGATPLWMTRLGQ